MYIGFNCTYFNKYCLVHCSHWSHVGCLHRSLYNRQIWSKVQRNDVFCAICWWLDRGCWGKNIGTVLSWKIYSWLWLGSNILDSSSKCQAVVLDVTKSDYCKLSVEFHVLSACLDESTCYMKIKNKFGWLLSTNLDCSYACLCRFIE